MAKTPPIPALGQKIKNVGSQLKAAPSALGKSKDKTLDAIPAARKIRSVAGNVAGQLGGAKDLAIKDVTQGFPKPSGNKGLLRKGGSPQPMAMAKASPQSTKAPGNPKPVGFWKESKLP
jgi:hypothetical protein